MSDGKQNTRIPEEFQIGHQLAFAIHDVLLQQLHAGWRGDAWVEEIAIDPAPESETLPKGEELLSWMLVTQTPETVASFLNRVVYPSLLGDVLHFLYEALECSRKGKTTVAFSLLRKPLKESLYILEYLSADPAEFSRRFQGDIASLYANDQREPHIARIQTAINAAGVPGSFDAGYIYQLRYDRKSEDSLAPSFDQSTHLVTTFSSIRTSPLNLNFVFSDYGSIMTHWAFIYSRLPYLLAYLWRICEHAFSRYGLSDPEYLKDVDRRIAALVVLWHSSIKDRYRSAPIDTFASLTHENLNAACVEGGWRCPTHKDLTRMAETGAWPGESILKVKARTLRYATLVKVAEAVSRVRT